MRKSLRSAVLIAALALAGTAALSAEPGNQQKREPNPAATIASGHLGGLHVAIDPTTGRLRQPTAEERKAMAREMARFLERSPKRLSAESHVGGLISMDLAGSYLNVYVARLQNDGSLAQACFTDAASALEFLAGDDAAAATWEDQ